MLDTADGTVTNANMGSVDVGGIKMLSRVFVSNWENNDIYFLFLESLSVIWVLS